MTPEELLANLYGEKPPENMQSMPVQNNAVKEPSLLNQDIDSIRNDVNDYSQLESMGNDVNSQQSGFWKDIAPKIVENAPEMALGNFSGRMLRKAIPEGLQFDPKLKDVLKTDLPNAYKDIGNIHEESMSDFDKRQAEREAHINQGQQLEREARMKQHELRKINNDLENAREQHLASQMLEPEHFISNQYPTEELQKPTSATLTEKPIGGSGTAAYAEKFGATPEEASRVPSMSVMQKENIPSIANSMSRVTALEPNVKLTTESPLLLTPEAQEYVKQRKLEELQREHERQSNEIMRKAEHQMAVKQVAQAKFQAEQEVKRLEKLRDQHARDTKEAHEKHEKHMASIPPEHDFSKANKILQEKSNLVDELEKKTNRQYGSILAKWGSKIAPRFIPDVGATFAPLEAEQAHKDYQSGNYARMFAHGLGAVGAGLQATNVPPLMGAGDLLQIPALGLTAYDMLKNNPSE